jgi:ribosomal protein S18 acetylase RimI-like enzyme
MAGLSRIESIVSRARAARSIQARSKRMPYGPTPTMKQRIHFRPATPPDVPFLLRLRELTMTEHLQRVGEPIDADAHVRRVWANFDDAVIVCEDDEDIGLLKLNRHADGWYLQQLQIVPARQGHGIGEFVLNAVLDDAKRAGVSVSLGVLHGNPARRLYERLGFRFVSESSIDATLTWRP